jgi:hypothetical protein
VSDAPIATTAKSLILLQFFTFLKQELLKSARIAEIGETRDDYRIFVGNSLGRQKTKCNDYRKYKYSSISVRPVSLAGTI